MCIRDRDKANYIKAQYDKATEEQKAEAVEMVWNEQSNKRILFKDENKTTPNSYGKEKIKELIAFPEGYNEKAWIKNYALKTFGVQVDFDSNDQIILASLINAPIESEAVQVGKFDRKKTAAPQEPKTTTPLPQVQEVKPARPEFSQQIKIEESEQDEKPIEQQEDQAEKVEAPSKISKFFGKYFK